MTDDPSLERAARSWMDLGPTEAPDHAVEAALLRIETTTQERDWRVQIPWRSRSMNPMSRIAAAAGAVAVVVLATAFVLRPGLGSIGGPGPSDSPSPSASVVAPGPSSSAAPTPTAAISPSPSVVALGTLGTRFVSPRHGYSIAHGSTWTITPATKPWTGKDGPDVAAGNIDTLSAPGIRLYVESAPLSGQTPASWRDAYAARFGLDGVGECDVLPANWPRIQIGTVSGYLDGNDCAGDGTVVPGDRFFEAQAFTGGRVYLFWIQGSVDRSTFESLLATVRFDAASAIDTP